MFISGTGSAIYDTPKMPKCLNKKVKKNQWVWVTQKYFWATNLVQTKLSFLRFPFKPANESEVSSQVSHGAPVSICNLVRQGTVPGEDCGRETRPHIKRRPFILVAMIIFLCLNISLIIYLLSFCNMYGSLSSCVLPTTI